MDVLEIPETVPALKLGPALNVSYETIYNQVNSRHPDVNLIKLCRKIQADPAWIMQLLNHEDMALDLLGLSRCTGHSEVDLKFYAERWGFPIRARFSRGLRFSLLDVSKKFAVSPFRALRLEKIGAAPEEHILTAGGYSGD